MSRNPKERPPSRTLSAQALKPSHPPTLSHESELELAWASRERHGLFASAPSPALRVFHGAGEGTRVFAQIAVDRFGDHYWVTEWQGGPEFSNAVLAERDQLLIRFLQGKQASSAVILRRPEKGVPSEPSVLFGEPPEGRFTCEESGGMKFRIQCLGARHPGLFLDHAPLRTWLRASSSGWKVLNTFAYTGSLSVAAGLGGAAHVTTLDLSNPTIRWAAENWETNGLPEKSARFIAGDVFEWLPRLRRESEKEGAGGYDCVILDPPSFSRGNRGNFSTSKDLEKLHSLALDLLAPGGVLVTSINSANVSWAKYEADVFSAVRAQGRSMKILSRIDLPETFPTRLGDPESRYLKGWVLKDR